MKVYDGVKNLRFVLVKFVTEISLDSVTSPSDSEVYFLPTLRM
jgi:hypothetical protein